MTQVQRNVLIVAGVVAVLMVLLPPWETPEDPRPDMLRGGWLYPADNTFVGYSALFSPPQMKLVHRDAGMGVFNPAPRYEPCVVSLRVLVVQYVALLLVFGAALIMQQHSSSNHG
jgi:hypothetical protein